MRKYIVKRKWRTARKVIHSARDSYIRGFREGQRWGRDPARARDVEALVPRPEPAVLDAGRTSVETLPGRRSVETLPLYAVECEPGEEGGEASGVGRPPPVYVA